MSDRREQQASTSSGSFRILLRLVALLAAVVAAVLLVAGAWNDVGAATGGASMRIFLLGWAVAAVVLVGFPFANALYARGHSTFHPVVLAAILHVTAGFLVGLAVGTTDWTSLRLAGWWQLWWTVPLLLGYADDLITLRRTSRPRP